MTTRTRRLVVAVAVLAVSALGACGGGDDEAGGDDPPAAQADDLLLPAGTELGDGLVVPEGAHLAGTVFLRSGYDPESLEPADTAPPPTIGPDGGTDPSTSADGPATTTPPLERDPGREEWTALLVVDGDPFAVFDDLAAQVRAIGPALSGTNDACLWQVVQDPNAPSAAQPTAVSAGAPTLPIDHLRCEAAARDDTRHIDLRLLYGGEHPGTLFVERRADRGQGPSSYGAGASAAQEQGPTAEPGPGVDDTPTQGTDGTTTSTTPPTASPFPVPGPEPVGDDVRALLPDPAPPPTPEAGDRFGGTGNCLATGYDQMVLPAGATLVATEAGGDGPSVLATDDVEATMDALLATGAEGSDADSFEASPREQIPLADGSTVSRQSFSIGGGGGACDLLASPDGHHVLVLMHSD